MQDRRHQVSETLSGAGAGLCDKVLIARERLRDACAPSLAVARAARNGPGVEQFDPRVPKSNRRSKFQARQRDLRSEEHSNRDREALPGNVAWKRLRERKPETATRGRTTGHPA